jgi:ATP-binding cassette subfamily B protein
MIGSSWQGQRDGAAMAAQGGLTFSGIPPELSEAVERITAQEPVWEIRDVPFSHRPEPGPPLTMRRLFVNHKAALVVALALIIVESGSIQAGPLLTQIGIDKGIVTGDLAVVIAAGIGYVWLVVLTTVTSGYRVAWTGRVAQKIIAELRVRVFAQQQRLSLDFYGREKAGVIMARMTSDVETLNQLLTDGLANLATQGLTMVLVTTILFVLNAKLAFLTVCGVVPILLLLSIWFRRVSERAYLRARDGIAAVLSDLQENLSGIRTVAAHNRQLHNIVHHRNVVGDYREANFFTALVGSIYGPGTEALGLLAQAAVLLLGGNMVLHQQLTLGELTAFLLYLTVFFAPIQALVQFYNSFQQGQAAITKLRVLLSQEPSVAESPAAVELPLIRGEINFDGVTFRYTPDGPDVLKDINLVISPGEMVAVVGATGSGKSTLAKLVARFYDPTEGSIFVDGHGLHTISFESLRRQLGVVPQEPFLFSGTLRDNIAFGRTGANEEEVLDAIRQLGLERLLARLPNGLDTYVHERGSSLSSGECQLVALARTFVARPRVVVLDEATSNLDMQSEQEVESALRVLLEGRTSIVIAHRLTTAMRADRIVVVDAGRIVESGPHHELLEQRGYYARLYSTWRAHTAPTDAVSSAA